MIKRPLAHPRHSAADARGSYSALALCLYAQPQCIKLDETFGITLIVGAGIVLKGRDVLVEQSLSDRRPTTMTLSL